LQHPGQLDRRLAAEPVPDLSRHNAECVKRVLEAHGPSLVAETRALLARSRAVRLAAGGGFADGLFTSEREGLHTPQEGFSHFDVLASCEQPACAAAGAGAPPSDACLVPAFCVALRDLASKTFASVGLARISRLQPGVSISLHTGLYNRRWRAHLGLTVPAHPTAQLRVGTTTLSWRESEAFIFDDSFEHEVTWRSAVTAVDLREESARCVLIIDFVHPDLAPVCP